MLYAWFIFILLQLLVFQNLLLLLMTKSWGWIAHGLDYPRDGLLLAKRIIWLLRCKPIFVTVETASLLLGVQKLVRYLVDLFVIRGHLVHQVGSLHITSTLVWLFTVGIALVNHCQDTLALVSAVRTASLGVTPIRVSDWRCIAMPIMRALIPACCRNNCTIIVNLFKIENSSNVLIVLLRDLHNFGHFERLFLKLLFGLPHLVLLLGYPLL